ncbi:MAG: hypothetical protein WCD76_01400 [Pyrinomonadaceae bacterium]
MRKPKNKVRRAGDPPRETKLALPKLTPKMVVGFVATLIVLLLLFGGDIRRALVGGYNPRIAFARGDGTDRRASRRASASPAQDAPVFDGEVYRTEGRLREASAIAIAASLSGVASSVERRPVQNVDGLIAEIINRRLLPPGVEFVPERNLFVSAHSTIYLRFRPDPFGVEVLSLGRERLDGAGLLVRVPDDVSDEPQRRRRYFYSFRLENINVPEAFAPASSVQAAGWQVDHFDTQLPEGANMEQLVRWTRQHGEQSR